MDSSSTLRSMLLFLAMVLTTGASASIDLTQTRPGEVQGISSVDAFENDVLKSPQIWLVVFSSSTTDELVNAAVELNSISVKVGLADIDDLGAIASEFNVRKRMLPVALLFKTRARDGEKLKAELFASPSEIFLGIKFDKLKRKRGGRVVQLKKQVEELLVDNPRDSDGNYQKITLTLGGGDL